MICPHCASTNNTKAGRNDHGIQRYKCSDCKRIFTGASLGRPVKYDDGLSAQQRWNNANKETLNRAQQARRKREKENDELV